MHRVRSPGGAARICRSPGHAGAGHCLSGHGTVLSVKRARSQKPRTSAPKRGSNASRRPARSAAPADRIAELERQLAAARAQLKARPSARVEAATAGIAAGGDVTESVLVTAQTFIVQMSGDGPWRREVLGKVAGTKGMKARLEAYLKHLHERHVFVEFRGLGMTGRVPLKLALEEIYIPARARIETPEGETTQAVVATGRPLPEEDRKALGERMGPPRPVESLLADHAGLVVLGDPGSGKTSFLKHLAVLHGTSRGPSSRLPVYLPLAAYAEHLGQSARNGTSPKPLQDFIALHHEADDIADLLEMALSKGRALLLLDGLDETRDQALRRRLVEAVVTFFQKWREQGNQFVITSRIVGYAAVRPNVPGLEECWLSDFDDADIEAFAERWTRAVERRERGEGNVAYLQAQARQRELLNAVAVNPGVRRLAASPILLTILALMQKAGERLPDRRAKLYDRCLETMLSTWNASKGVTPFQEASQPVTQTLKVLAPLALWMHTAHDGYGLVPKQRLESQLQDILLRRKGHPVPAQAPDPARVEAEEAAADFMKDVHGQCSLLLERAPGRYGFLHQSFQDYLAGVGLVMLENERRPSRPARKPAEALGQAGVIEAMRERLAAPQSADDWREPLLLAVGYVGLVHVREEFAAAMLRGWMNAGAGGLLLAGEAVADLGAEAVGSACFQDVLHQLRRLRDQRDAPARSRADAARWIGHLGDDRPGVGVLPRKAGSTPPMRPDFAWCGPDPKDPRIPFPAGTFLMGGDPKAIQSSKEPFECHRVRSPFMIARFPVTVRQFRAFVEDGGYANAAYWPGAAQAWLNGEAKDWEWYYPILRERYLKRRFPIRHPEDFTQPFQAPNSPRVGVSWFEADAYVRWLRERFHPEEWGLGPGWQPMLPSEAEWELAARWDGRGTQRALPWAAAGSDETLVGHCNFSGAGVERTSAVGLFSPEGDAYCGAADMVGNVWEWCRDPWRDMTTEEALRQYDGQAEPAEPSRDKHPRVLRGGSWFYVDPGLLRCAARLGGVPGDSYGGIGFRVVCVGVMASGG